MRIAYLSTMAGFYGGEVHLADLAAGMRDRGHDVVCIVRPGSQLDVRLRRRGLPVVAMPLLHWYEPWGMARLGRFLRERGIQVLHSHVPRDYYMAAVATAGSGIANVGTRHQLFAIGLPFLKRPFLGRFQALIAVSEAVRKSLVASHVLDPDRIITIPNGIPPVRTRPAGSPWAGHLHLACGAAATDPLIGFVGRICPTKGLETLLRAAALLRDDWPRLKLCIIGQEDGATGYLDHLQSLVEDLRLEGRVHFLGYREDARTAAGEFAVQVVCSRAEPFGLVTLEAMAQGRPVVVTDTGGSPEIVRDGVEGFLVRPDDPGQLARRLDVLLDSPGLSLEMGARGRRRVARHFGLEQMLVRTEQVYRQVAGPPLAREAAAGA